MLRTIRVSEGPAGLEKLDPGSPVPPLAVKEWESLRPDLHFMWMSGGQLSARCSVWMNQLPDWKGHSPVAVGHFEAAGRGEGVALLHAVMGQLKEEGESFAVGPMNANTWNSYRLVVEDVDGRSPFLMEPFHPSFYTDAWREAGFEPLVNYVSGELPVRLSADSRMTRVIERLKAQGVRIRNFRAGEFDQELERIHAVSCVAFAGNHFYAPISLEGFRELYRPYRDRLVPELIFIAERKGETVGFLFGVPDYLQAARSGNMDTVIYKTVAILPNRELAGLGLWLTHIGHSTAERLGYRKVIHAMVTSQSRLGDARWEGFSKFREYSLMGRHF